MANVYIFQYFDTGKSHPDWKWGIDLTIDIDNFNIIKGIKFFRGGDNTEHMDTHQLTLLQFSKWRNPAIDDRFYDMLENRVQDPWCPNEVKQAIIKKYPEKFNVEKGEITIV